MDEAILTDNDRKAELSFAYVAAFAAPAGYTCQRGSSSFDERTLLSRRYLFVDTATSIRCSIP